MYEYKQGRNLKGSHMQPEGRAKSAENIRALPFKHDLSIDTTFIHIYLDGQDLYLNATLRKKSPRFELRHIHTEISSCRISRK